MAQLVNHISTSQSLLQGLMLRPDRMGKWSAEVGLHSHRMIEVFSYHRSLFWPYAICRSRVSSSSGAFHSLCVTEFWP